MRRVLILIKGLGRGGAEQLLVSAAPYWARNKFRYEIAYVLPSKDALVEDLEAFDVPVHCLGGAGVSWLLRLRELVRDRDIDLVHSHLAYTAIGARLMLVGTGVPLVYTEHIVWECYHPATYWANLVTFFRDDYVFTVSDDVRRSIQFPTVFRVVPPPAMETLYHGLDPAAVAEWAGEDVGHEVRSEFGIGHDAPVVVTVANFKAHKGYEFLLDAAVRVRHAFRGVRFIFVGQGPLESEVRAAVTRRGLDGTVVFAGHRSDVPRIVGAGDVFALASLHEGLSIALLEAMAVGTPPVVTAVGGLPEVVTHGRDGLVVPPREPGLLASAITRLLEDKELRLRLSQAARKRAGDFDIRRPVRRAEEVYELLLELDSERRRRPSLERS
jgi:glycosyltransferase involved in cell wall biosynthesis